MKIAVVANSAWYLYNFRRRLMQALRDGDGALLEQSFQRAKEARDRCVVPQANVRRQ